MKDISHNVVVLDMQPIHPPVGGGRIRLLGLYHGLGIHMPTTYIGTYDWPGETYRKHQISESLIEIDIPLSDEHFSQHKLWQDRVGGKTIIDVTFPQLAHLSHEFIQRAKEETRRADVVVFSHPWVYPLVKDVIRHRSQFVVYDSHNFEGLLRTMLLDDGGFGSEIAENAVKVEYELSHFADIILVCSHEDRELFNRFYKVPFKKIRVAPNGVFASQLYPVDVETKRRIKKELGLKGKKLAIFLGSAYEPNVEAAEFICSSLATKLPEITFAVCGSVGDGLSESLTNEGRHSNVIITGFLSEEEKLRYLAAADFAINPMFSGSGTNIKMFDFMACALPIVTTRIGARGIEGMEGSAFRVCSSNDFSIEILSLIKQINEAPHFSKGLRRLAEEKYSWEIISRKLGNLFYRFRRNLEPNVPFFTVIIPTYRRHDRLKKLMKLLEAQAWRDFEVIVIDQTEELWPERNKDYNFSLFYIHTKIKGAVRARNLGCFYARGEVLAFTDDDCEPKIDWLQKARPYFDKPNVVGVEGLIMSEKFDDPMYRTVDNDGFEGFGFMTANLFLRHETFNAINGFDERFDNPHFREDTDLAWRALDYGEIPYAREVEVFHPPHLRTTERESKAERTRFFEKDALLLLKHPEKYRILFQAEAHGEKTPGFWDNFLRGARKYGVAVPEFYL